MGGQGCALHLLRARATAKANAKGNAKAKAKAALVFCGLGGAVWAGRTPRNPTPLRLRQFPGDGGKEHWVTDELMENKKDAAFAASFLFGSALPL